MRQEVMIHGANGKETYLWLVTLVKRVKCGVSFVRLRLSFKHLNYTFCTINDEDVIKLLSNEDVACQCLMLQLRQFPIPKIPIWALHVLHFFGAASFFISKSILEYVCTLSFKVFCCFYLLD